MRRASLALCLFVIGCGPKYRQETLGTAYAGQSVTLSAPGQHRIDWRVQVPRAFAMTWTVDCGGTVVDGTAGETFEQYRDRRIAELRAQREEEKKAVGAVVGMVGASADVQTPEGEGHVEARADGEAVADAVVSDDIQLPAGDVGPGFYGGTVTVFAQQPGACTMRFDGEDMSSSSASFQVTRIVDIAAERAAMQAEARAHAIEVRGSLSARLVAQGADPELQARLQAEAAAKREAELKVRLEIEAQARAEQEERDRRDAEERARRQAERDERDRVRNAERAAELEAELRVRQETEERARVEMEAKLRLEADLTARIHVSVVETRQAYLAYLVGVCGAEPGYRERVAQEQADAEVRMRAEIEMRGELALEIRERWAYLLVGWGADPDYRARLEREETARRAHEDAVALERRESERRAREAADAEAIARMEAEAREQDRRLRIALGVRSEVVAYLLLLGAIEKPPMPDPMYEDPGEPPMSGAVWVAGEWVWQDAQWVWMSGAWSFPDDGYSSTGGGIDVDVHVGGGSVTVGGGGSVTVEDHRDGGSDGGTVEVEDHRDSGSDGGTVKVEDHRDEKKDEDRPKVRDHRDEDKKKKSKTKTDEDRPKVRDHRN